MTPAVPFIAFFFLIFTQPVHANPSLTNLQRVFEGAKTNATVSSWISVKKRKAETQIAPQEPPKKRALKKPLPPGVEPKTADLRSRVGFAAGFLALESPALLVMQTPYLGKPLGWLIFLVLLPAAVIAGAAGALIGLLT